MFHDLALFFRILKQYQGCRFGKIDELAEEEVDLDVKVQLYNEVRSTLIGLYKKLQRYMKKQRDAEEKAIKKAMEGSSDENDDDDNNSAEEDITEEEIEQDEVEIDYDFFHVEIDDFY